MVKRSLFFLLILLLLASCAGSKIGREAPTISHQLPLKSEPSPSFLHSTHVHPIHVNEYSFVEVSEWYDENTILFLKDENGISYLQRHNIETGEIEDFFQIDEHIVYVSANVDNSLFAIQTVAIDSSTPVYIVDKDGIIIFKLTEIGEDFSYFWNSYRSDEMIIVSYLPNWEFDVYHLFSNNGQLKKLDLNQTYFQWLSENTIAYLDWDNEEPNYQAPLYSYSLDQKEKKKIAENIIAFFAYSGNVLLTITVNSLEDDYSVYTFYQHMEQWQTFQVPKLDTYSDQWWIPFHAYNHLEQTFLFQRPLHSGAFYEYDGPFEIVSYDLNERKEEVLIEIDYQVPMKLSPDGKWLLLGNQLEMLLQVDKKKMYPLIDFES